MSDGPELLPCPFCGGKAHLCTRNRPYPWIAKCDECGAIAGGSAFQNNEWNAHCWNIRADHCQTLIAEAVAAEREAMSAGIEAKVGRHVHSQSLTALALRDIAAAIRARTDAEALAALEARDKRVRDEALREIKGRADEMQDAAHQIHKDGGSALALLVLSFCELIDADEKEP